MTKREREVVDVYRCNSCNRMITSTTTMKVGGCRFCGSAIIRGTTVTFLQILLIKIGVIR